jgi:hypothetical protein
MWGKYRIRYSTAAVNGAEAFRYGDCERDIRTAFMIEHGYSPNRKKLGGSATAGLRIGKITRVANQVSLFPEPLRPV